MTFDKTSTFPPQGRPAVRQEIRDCALRAVSGITMTAAGKAGVSGLPCA